MANTLTLNHESEASCYEEQLTANLVGKCRTEELDGVKYLVAKISALFLVVFALTTAQVSYAARVAPEDRTKLATSQGIRNSPQAMANRSRAGKLRWIKQKEIA